MIDFASRFIWVCGIASCYQGYVIYREWLRVGQGKDIPDARSVIFLDTSHNNTAHRWLLLTCKLGWTTWIGVNHSYSSCYQHAVPMCNYCWVPCLWLCDTVLSCLKLQRHLPTGTSTLECSCSAWPFAEQVATTCPVGHQCQWPGLWFPWHGGQRGITLWVVPSSFMAAILCRTSVEKRTMFGPQSQTPEAN